MNLNSSEVRTLIDVVPDASHDETNLLASEISTKISRCILEDFTQCSKSHLWKLMMSFYDRKGKLHPFFISFTVIYFFIIFYENEIYCPLYTI